MLREDTLILMLQLSSDPDLAGYFNALRTLLSIAYAFALHGYLILVLLGFMVYATGLSDGTAKSLVLFGVFLFFAGPMTANFLAGFIGVDPITEADATAAFLSFFGMLEGEFLSLLVLFGDGVMAICIVVGAILYFNPTSNDLKSRGHSLMVRGVILAAVLSFVYVSSIL